MIHVHAHPERMMFREDRAQLRRDSLWQKNRDARADAEKFDVLYRAQPRQKTVSLVFAENQRVTAAQQHVTHFGVLFEITECLLEIGAQFLFPDATDHTAAGAISTISRATIGHEKENAVGIAMH